MTRLSKVDSFKTVDSFIRAIETAKVDKKTFGGYKVTLNVTIRGKDETIKVSRNQLAKLALDLAETEYAKLDRFTELKDALKGLNAQGKGGGRITKLKQKVGNAIFKLINKADRESLLNKKAGELDPLKASSDRKEIENTLQMLRPTDANAVNKEFESLEEGVAEKIKANHKKK